MIENQQSDKSKTVFGYRFCDSWKKENFFQGFSQTLPPLKNSDFGARLKKAFNSKKGDGKARLQSAEDQNLLLTKIIDESLNEIFIADADTLKILYANAGALRHLGYELDEILEMTVADFSPGRTKNSLLRILNPLREKQEQVLLEGKNLRKDGTVYEVETKIHFSKAGGRPVFVIIVEDVSKKNLANRLLHQSSKMEAIGQISSGVAHDFNNLLTAIKGSLSILKGMKIPKKAQPLIKMAIDATNRGTSLTNRLLAYSRQQDLTPSKIEANRLIKEMEPLLKATMGNKIEVDFKYSIKRHNIFVDTSLIGNGILNLAINSRDAMPSGGKLTIRVMSENVSPKFAAKNKVKPGKFVILEITDTGAGMSPHVMEKAFDPFFTTKEVGKGTGLGLSSVVGMVRQSGGFVKMISVIGQGTQAKIYLPRVGKKQDLKLKKPENQKDKPKSLKEKIILIVDENEKNLEYAEKILKAQNHFTLKAKNAAEARVHFARYKKIDLLITEVELNGDLCGRQLGEEFKSFFPGGNVLFCTDQQKHLGKGNGNWEIDSSLLIKPYQPTALLMTVGQMFS